jgi:hypothetical protein
MEVKRITKRNHWSGRGRAASVGNSGAVGRPRRSVWTLGAPRMEALLYFACAAVVTALITGAICRKQQARRKRASFIAVVGGAVISTLICYFGSLLCDFGSAVFTSQFWSDPKGSAGLSFYSVSTAVPSTLVALVVVGYYRHRHKHEDEMA